ncbi:hypothetical protein JCM9957A_30970 [Kineosporia succinea]
MLDLVTGIALATQFRPGQEALPRPSLRGHPLHAPSYRSPSLRALLPPHPEMPCPLVPMTALGKRELLPPDRVALGSGNCRSWAYRAEVRWRGEDMTPAVGVAADGLLRQHFDTTAFTNDGPF